MILRIPLRGGTDLRYSTIRVGVCFVCVLLVRVVCVCFALSVCVCVYCESCMYLVCRASVLSFRWSGVRRVEL